MALPDDPEQRALLYVQQYLHELGHGEALAALERSAGLVYDSDKCTRGGHLLELVYDQLEAELLTTQDPLQSERQKEEQYLLQGGAGDFATTPLQVLSGFHSSNVLVVRLLPGGQQLITGAADGSVQLLDCSSAAAPSSLWTQQLSAVGGVLSIELSFPSPVPPPPPAATAATAANATTVAAATTTTLAAAAATTPANAATRTSSTVTPNSSSSSGGTMGNMGVSPATSSDLLDSENGSSPEQQQQGGPGPLSSTRGCQVPPFRVVVGCMNGSVHVLDGCSGRILCSSQPHSKYVVRAQWSPCGNFIATASFDNSLTLMRLCKGEGQAASAAAATAGGEEEAGGKRGTTGDVLLSLETVKQRPYTHFVQDVIFIPPVPSTTAAAGVESSPCNGAISIDASRNAQQADGAAAAGVESSTFNGATSIDASSSAPEASGVNSCLLLAAVRGLNAIQCFDGSTCEALPPINLNGAGDKYVSFSAMKFALSYCGSYLLVATDSPRLLILRTKDWTQLRVLYGLPEGQFHNPAICWHRDPFYIYASAAAASIMVYHVGSAKPVRKVSGHHKINVRDIHYDPQSNRLASCSFDKAVIVYG